MRRTSNFTKKTRSGKILTVSREHYLRDDLYCGSEVCTVCPMRDEERKLQKLVDTPNKQYFVVDTNVLLHQMDLLEACAAKPERGLMMNLIILQTVLDEVRGNNLKLYTRVRAFIASHPHAVVFSNEHHRATYVERVAKETPNDRNDRAIRVATAWYAAHLPTMRITLLTNDKDNRAKASVGLDRVDNMNVPEFIALHGKKYPDLAELVARMSAFEKEREKGAWTYPDHLAPADITAGLASGKLKKGTYKVNRDYFSESTVSARGSDPIFIPDLLHSNRAIDGDIVIVELLPRSQWKAPSKRLAPSMEEDSLLNTTGAEHGTGADVDGLTADVAASVSGAKPTGKVVGIFKRNWRPYCGSLEVSTKKKGNLLFLSVNKRIPRIRISTSQAEALMDKRILVQIDSWPSDSKYPLGHYTKTLGDIGEKDTETQVLLIEHDIPTAPWSQNVLACLPKDEFNIDQAHCAGRSDFRKLEIFSIDPPG
jgi:exosome complex exonuclease DIS3/RRP44